MTAQDYIDLDSFAQTIRDRSTNSSEHPKWLHNWSIARAMNDTILLGQMLEEHVKIPGELVHDFLESNMSVLEYKEKKAKIRHISLVYGI